MNALFFNLYGLQMIGFVSIALRNQRAHSGSAGLMQHQNCLNFDE